MKLKLDSSHALIYQYIYATDTLPKSLCPYFWKLFLAIVLFIPYSLIVLPYIIMQCIFNEELREDGFWKRIGWSFLLYGCIASISWFIVTNYHMIKAIFGFYSYNREWASMGAIFWTFIILITLFILIINGFEKLIIYSVNKKYETKQSSIIGEFIKAKIGKYCPKIDWE